MNIRKLAIVALAVLVAVAGVSVAGAQGGPGRPDRPEPGPIRLLIDIVAQETGLDAAAIVEQLQAGETLERIIVANGGDVGAVVGLVVTELTERINQGVAEGRITQERADRILSNLEDRVRQGISGELFPDRVDRGAVGRQMQQILMQAVAEATGLRPVEIMRQVRAGTSLEEVINANGGDVNAVLDAAIAEAAEQINAAVADGRLTQEQADELLAGLPMLFQDYISGELGQRRLEMRVGLGVVRLAAEQTGLEPREIVEQLRSGKSLAEILTENGVDVTVFMDAAIAQVDARLDQSVASGQITQERADELLAQFRERLAERVDQPGSEMPVEA